MFVCLQDYNDHIAEISAKLVAIMDSLFEKVLSKVSSRRKITINKTFVLELTLCERQSVLP